MPSAKIMDPPRRSIFDDLNEKYPELGRPTPVKAPLRPKRSRVWVGTSLMAILGVSAWGLFLQTEDLPPSRSWETKGTLAFEQAKMEEETTDITANLEIPAPTSSPLADAQEETPVALPADTAPIEGFQPVSAISKFPPTIAPQLQSFENPTQGTAAEPSEPTPVAFPEEAILCDASELREPVKLNWAAPEYPETARQAFQEGSVVVEAQVDATGVVENVRTLRGAAPELDRAALAAVASWSFEPATCAGQPVAGEYRTALHFNLKAPETKPVDTIRSPSEPPVRLFAPQPTYPPAEWVAAIEGDVTLRATVNEAGLVADVEVLKGVSPGLDKAAVQALERWRFRPARRGDELASFAQVLTFRFRR